MTFGTHSRRVFIVVVVRSHLSQRNVYENHTDMILHDMFNCRGMMRERF